MIKLKNISRFYSTGHVDTYVLRRINIDVNKGEFITIMGPSGAGKSTLLNIIGMLDTASEGEYYFLDEEVHTLNEKGGQIYIKNISVLYFRVIISLMS